MTTPLPVWLFDLDGVLIAPRGYRRAVVATVLHFAHRWGWEPHPPTDADMAQYEAHGITSEWDMVPLMLAALLETAAAHGLPLPPSLPDPAAAVVPQPQRRPIPQPAYAAPAAALRHADGVFPATQAWHLQQGPQPMFPGLRHRPDLLRALLTHTRDAWRSPTTRVFQHYVLGAQEFSRTYGQPAAFPSPSFLLTYDEPLPATAWLQTVYQAWQTGALHLAVMTARPSRPRNKAQGYAPEAEMALQRLGWPHAPHIGYGHVRATTEQGEGYLKPHPVHALAALHAALTGQMTESVTWALQAWQHPTRAAAMLPPALRLTVVEDSPPGLRAAQAAATWLHKAGVQVDLHLVGIATHPAKVQALQRIGARVAPSVDAAVARGWLPHPDRVPTPEAPRKVTGPTPG